MDNHIGGVERGFKDVFSLFTVIELRKTLHQPFVIPGRESRHHLRLIPPCGNAHTLSQHTAGKQIAQRLPHHCLAFRSKYLLEHDRAKVAGRKYDNGIVSHQGFQFLGQLFMPPSYHGDEDQLHAFYRLGQIVRNLRQFGKSIEAQPGHLHPASAEYAVYILAPVGFLFIQVD